MDLLGLAAADEGRRVGPVTALDDPADGVGAGGVDELGELVEVHRELVLAAAGELHADEHDLLAERPLDEPAGGLAAELAEPAAVLALLAWRALLALLALSHAGS